MKQPTSRPLIEWVMDLFFNDDVDRFLDWHRTEKNGESITSSYSRTRFEKLLRKYKSYKKRIEEEA